MVLAGICLGAFASAHTAQNPTIYSVPYDLTYLFAAGLRQRS